MWQGVVGLEYYDRVQNVMPGWVRNVFIEGYGMFSWLGVEFQRILNFK